MMNLADIRKKALQERRAAGPAAAVPHQPSPAPTVQDPIRVSAPDEPFDPLGVILSGREAVAAARSRDVATPHVPAMEELTGFLGFRVGEEMYAVAIDRVREIIRPRTVTPVPRVHSAVSGILSHRGTIVSILDLSLRLGIETSVCTGIERIIVVRYGDGCCGLLVNRITRVHLLPVSTIEPVPPAVPGGTHEFVSGIAWNRGTMLALLDLDKVLDLGGHST